MFVESRSPRDPRSARSEMFVESPSPRDPRSARSDMFVESRAKGSRSGKSDMFVESRAEQVLAPVGAKCSLLLNPK